MGTSPRVYRYRSFIWPAVLIMIGVVALLINLNLIPVDRLYRLADLWPLLLIVVGLELLVTRTPMPTNAMVLAGALIVLLAAGGAVAYMAAGPAIPGGTRSLNASGAEGDLQAASVEVDVGAATITIRGSDSLKGDLFRAHIEYSGPAPDVSFDRTTGHVQISQNNGFPFIGPQRFKLDLLINSRAKWDFTIDSGATTSSYELANVSVGSMQLDTGASRDDITLGPPSGSVPITIDGGAMTINLHRPRDAAAEVKVSGAAVSLDFDGRQQHAVGDLSASTEPEPDMYHVQVNGAACTVTMDTNTPLA